MLVVGCALERDELQIGIVGYRTPREPHLEARLPFVIEDALAPIADVDLHVALVVLDDELTGLRRDLQPEHPRTRFRRGEADAHRDGVTVRGQLHRLGADNAPSILDVERDGLPRISGLRHDSVDQQRGALQRCPRSGDTADLNVVRERFLADAHGEHGQCVGLRREQRVRHGRVGRIGAIAHEYEPGHRQTGEFSARAFNGIGEPRLRAAERQVRRDAHTSCRR